MPKEIKPWYGIDLDGTLAYYDEWRGIDHIGEPIIPMLNRVKQFLEEGKEVRIFTARVYHDGSEESIINSEKATAYILSWCIKHIGRILPVTCQKDMGLIEYWDDRAIQVILNTGHPVAGPMGIKK